MEKKEPKKVGFDASISEKIRRLDDKTLCDAIRKLARAAGIDEAQTEWAVSNAAKVREGMCAMSPDQLQKLTAKLSPEQTESVLRELQKEKLV